MKHIWVLLISALLCSHPQLVFSQSTLRAELLAGSDFRGFLDGTGAQTMFNFPTAIAVDNEGIVYVWDSVNRTIRRIAQDGVVKSHPKGTLANVTSLDMLPGGNIAAADGSRIRNFSSYGNVNDMAGAGTGYEDGFGSDSRFGSALAIAVDADGSILVADTQNHRIRRVSGAKVTTIAGSGNIGTVDGEGLFSSFSYPDGIAVNTVGTIFVHQRSGETRTISPEGKVGRSSFSSSSEIMVFDQDDNFYSATGNSVQQYSPNFDHLLTIPIEGTVGGIAVSENGYLYVTSATTHKIFRVKLGERAPPPEARLSAEILPVVTIDGALGRAYSIQASESLGANWQTLDVIQMTKPTETWIDRTSLKGHRFYRAVLVE